MADKKEYRVFKVAKELNVSSNTLVEYLQKHGHKTVSGDLNAKVSQDQYDLLLKQFGSDRTQKLKADQEKEHRKEELRISKTTVTPVEKIQTPVNEDVEHINATQLRNEIEKKPEKLELIQKPKILGKIDLDALKKKPKGEEKNEVPVQEKVEVVEFTQQLPLVLDVPEKKEKEHEPPLTVEKNTPPIISEQKIPPVKEETQSPAAELVDVEKSDKEKTLQGSKDTPQFAKNIHKLKVEKVNQEGIEKEIKLETPVSEIVKPKIESKPIVQEKEEVKVSEIKTEPVVSEEPKHQPKIEETKVEAKVEPNVELKAETKVESKEEKKENPQYEVRKPYVKEQKKEEFVPKKEKAAPVVPVNQVAEDDDDDSDNDNDDDSDNDTDVIRASGNVPTLSGLKVLGKINLDDPKDKKKKKKKRKKEKDKLPVTPLTEKEKAEKEKAAKDKPIVKDGLTRDKDGAITVIKAGDVAAADADAEKRKRKRKRKRKKPVAATPGTGTATTGEQQVVTTVIDENKKRVISIDRRPKKEKISDKDVQDSIRNTLAEMQKGASRSRQKMRRQKRDDVAVKRGIQADADAEQEKVLRITEFITANEFAELIGVPVTEIIKKCFLLGIMVSINQRLDAEVITIIAEEYDLTIDFIDVTEEELQAEEEEDDEADMITRNPVITVMGHVDHGKTTLLDYLRKENVAGGEAGGITQHIGAYEVKLKSGNRVTFLDTPGHEAFTAMRARGTKVTDVAIIVIAADDAVMPTTKEAIAHAQAAGVKMVFAINKIDKAGADSQRIKTQLAEMNLLVEDWGGNYQCQEIAAKFGTNVDLLLEKVILESDILDLKANPKRHASGSVIESRLDKGRGNVITMLVQNGTLRVGDVMVAGIHYGKVRALINQKGERIQEAGPSTPVQVLGLSGLPQAGDKFQVYQEESKAKEIAQKRHELYREQQFRQTKRMTLEEIGRRKSLGNFKELNLIIKGDVDGSVEAIAGSLMKLGTEEVSVNILHKGTGAITETDITLAAASDALIIAFNVRPTPKGRGLAEKEGVSIRTYSIIYDAINDVKDALEGMLSPEIKEELAGTLEIRQVFKVKNVGTIAGSYVTSGKVLRSDPVRVIRDSVVIADTEIESLKRFREDVREVSYGYECGIMLKNFNDIQEGDIIESYKVKEIKRKLS
jgi:translation initiation factor IF-2